MVAIHPDSTSPHAIRDRVCLFDVTCPNACRESIVRSICPCDDFVEILKRNDAHNGAEDFFLGNLHVVPNIGEHGRLDEVATISHPLAAAGKCGTLTPP